MFSTRLLAAAVAAFFVSTFPVQAAPFTLHLTGNASAETLCTGNGLADILACDGPFLTPEPVVLSTNPPARWLAPQASVADGTNGRTIYDFSWIWNVPAAVNLGGTAEVKWWASCSTCVALGGTWAIRIWADDDPQDDVETPTFERTVTATPALPGVPSLLSASFVVPDTVIAAQTVVVHIDPVFPMGPDTVVYYDSDSPCPGAQSIDACDSTISFGGTTPPPPSPPTVRAADARDPGFAIYPTTTTIQSDLFGAGEPTLDVNYATGSVFMRFILGTAKAVFNDTASPPTVTWSDVTDPINGLASIPGLDPFIGGSYLPVKAGAGVNPALVGTPDTTVPSRIFTMQLLAGTSAMSYSDDDGATWTVGQGGGEPAGADNQSLAAGPYPADFLLGPVALEAYAVYYCSHSSVNAFCSRSDDGGMTFKNSFPIFPADGLCGNHGHVKVGPDGTVYVPMNNSCQGSEGVTFSIDGGITWTYVTVPNTSQGRWDSSIAIARDGVTLYYAYAELGTDEPMVIKGTLIKGPTPTIQWDEDSVVNVGKLTGATSGLKNIVFSTMVAGDADRAAMIFHGTTTDGDSGDPATMANAVWHLYAATTLDGGEIWALNNLTPNDPTQKGAICDDGTTCTGNTRNLLDFIDAVVDGQGRIVVSFADGCTGPCMSPTGAANNNDYGTLARQSSGPRLYAAFDPAPAAPVVVTPTVGDARVTLDWNDVSGATGYKVFQSTVSGSAGTQIAAPSASAANITTGLSNGTTYYFTVKAVNAAGDSPASNEVSATPSAGPVELTATLAATSYSKTADAQGRYPVSAGSPLEVNFTVSTVGGDGSPKRYYMNFGDGSEAGPQASPTFVHRYANAGTQRAYAIVTQNNGNDSDTSNEVVITTFPTVVVDPGEETAANAVLAYAFTGDNDNVAPATVTFTTTGSTGTSYVLDFGNGDSPATPNQISGTGVPPSTVSRTYRVPGTYTATLTLSGEGEPATHVATQTFTVVAVRELTAQLSVSPSSVVAGDTDTPVTMDASNTVPANGKTLDDYEYTFDFDDGTVIGPGDDRSATHVYASAGTFEPTLTVTEKAPPVGQQARFSIAKSEVRSTLPRDETPAPVRGGGALGLGLLLPMLLLALKRSRRLKA